VGVTAVNSAKGLAALLAALLSLYLVVTLFASHSTSSDEVSYVAYAERLTHGSYSGRGTDVDLWFGPGLPLLLTPLAAVDAPIELMRAVGALLLVAGVGLFYVLLRKTVSPRAALLGTVALGLYWPLLTLLPTIHSEIPALVAVILFMLSVTSDLTRPRAWTLLGAAASLAYLAVTRVVFGWALIVVLVLALIVFLAIRSSECKRLALISACALVLSSPWLVYTYDVTGKPFYWATSGGLSLYWMSSPYPEEYGDWHSEDEVFTNPGLADHRAFFKRLSGLNQVEFDEKVREEAIRQIRRDPQEYVENVAANVSRLWFSTPFSYTPQKLSTTFYIVPAAFLLVGLLAGSIVVARSRPRPPGSAAFAIMLVAGIGVQALLAGYTRMLFPLLPIMLWFVVQGAVRSR
jgi:hypothetical protein